MGYGINGRRVPAIEGQITEDGRIGWQARAVSKIFGTAQNRIVAGLKNGIQELRRHAGNRLQDNRRRVVGIYSITGYRGRDKPGKRIPDMHSLTRFHNRWREIIGTESVNEDQIRSS